MRAHAAAAASAASAAAAAAFDCLLGCSGSAGAGVAFSSAAPVSAAASMGAAGSVAGSASPVAASCWATATPSICSTSLRLCGGQAGAWGGASRVAPAFPPVPRCAHTHAAGWVSGGHALRLQPHSRELHIGDGQRVQFIALKVAPGGGKSSRHAWQWGAHEPAHLTPRHRSHAQAPSPSFRAPLPPPPLLRLTVRATCAAPGGWRAGAGCRRQPPPCGARP